MGKGWSIFGGRSAFLDSNYIFFFSRLTLDLLFMGRLKGIVLFSCFSCMFLAYIILLKVLLIVIVL